MNGKERIDGMSMKGRPVRLDAIAHWIWTILFMLLALSGFPMMGARFGWMFGYDFGFADFVHRIVSVLFIVWVFLALLYAIKEMMKRKPEKISWLPVGKKGFSRFTFFVTLLLIFSGFLLWFHPLIPYLFGTFGFMIHEIAALVSIGSIVWHIYVKRYILQDIVKRK